MGSGCSRGASGDGEDGGVPEKPQNVRRAARPDSQPTPFIFQQVLNDAEL